MKFHVIANPFCWSHKDEPRTSAATSTDAYQKMLDGIAAQAKAADRLGFESMMFSEQHGNIEGVPEVTNNPILLDWFVGAQTTRLKVGQIGCVLPVSNPLLVAEEIAQLDQMTQGRVIAGFSRGNSTRWVDQYGQLNGMVSAKSDKSESDERNLRAFTEAWNIIKLAWTEDYFSFEGEFWTYPVPGTKWSYPATKKWGGGVDSDDNLTRVSVVPKPYQKPHPRIFAPISGRTAIVKICARDSASVVSFAANDEFNAAMLAIYAKEAVTVGREPKRGEGIVVGGSLAISTNPQKAARYADEFYEWYSLYYGCPPYNLPHGRAFVGTPDQIVEQIGQINEALGIDEFMILSNVGAPHGYEESQEMLELFGTDVLPQFSTTQEMPEVRQPVGFEESI